MPRRWFYYRRQPRQFRPFAAPTDANQGKPARRIFDEVELKRFPCSFRPLRFKHFKFTANLQVQFRDDFTFAGIETSKNKFVAGTHPVLLGFMRFHGGVSDIERFESKY